MINVIATPKKQSKPKIRVNLKKFIFWASFIKTSKLRYPTKKLKIKDGHPLNNKTGFSKKR